MQEDEFASVLAAAQAGAGWAFERLYRWLAPAVVGYLRGQGAPEPEDQTSEVFLGVVRGIDRFAGGAAQFRSWVFTIAHRRLTDGRRHNGRRPVHAELDPASAVMGGDTEHDALDQLGTASVRALCAGLVPEQRDVLLLRLVAGLTVEQVAATTGRSIGATKALQRRGLGALRRNFDTEGVPL